MSEIFISYSREDTELVRKVHESLSKMDRDAWVDWEDIPPTAEWINEIYSAIEAADTFVFVISPDSVKSEICSKEIDHAVKQNKRIVPVVCREVNAKEVHEQLAKLNWIFFRESDDFQGAFKTLTEAIDTDLDYVRAHTRLLVRAREWESKENDKSFLLGGSDLKDAEDWLAVSGGKEPKPTSLQTQYIINSRKNSTRRQRFILGAVTFGLIVAIALALLAFFQRQAKEHQRQIALSRQLAAEARNHMDDKIDLALLLGIEANKIAEKINTDVEGVTARGSLLDVIGSSPHLSTFLRGHNARVESVAFNPKVNLLASGDAYGRIILWDTATRKKLEPILDGQTCSVTSITFNSDGNLLASGCVDGKIILWDIESHQQLAILSANKSRVSSVAFSPKSNVLASGCVDGKIILWDVESQQPINPPLTGHRTPVVSVSFSPDGKMLASGGQDNGTIILWDVVNRDPIGDPLFGHDGTTVTSVAFSPIDNSTLASGGKDNSVILWDIEVYRTFIRSNNATKGKNQGESLALDSQMRTLTGHSNWVVDLAFSPDGKTLASGSWDGTIILWDIATGRPIDQPLQGHTEQVTSVAFSPDGKTLASGSRDNTVILWDVTANRIPATTISKTKGREIPWDVAVSQPPCCPLADYDDFITSVTVSPDGKTIAAGTGNNNIVLIDIASRKVLNPRLERHDSTVWAVTFSSDSNILASGSRDGKVILWDVANRKPLGPPLTRHNGWVRSLAFNQQGSVLASVGSDGSLILSTVDDRRHFADRILPKGRAVSVAFSRDGNTLAVGNENGSITFFDVLNRRWLDKIFKGHDNWVRRVVFNRDGKLLASCSDDFKVILWDTESGQGTTLSGHTNWVFSVAFSPDNTTLASVSHDGSLIFWDVETGRPLSRPITRHRSWVGVGSMTFSPKDNIVASGGADGNIVLWDVNFKSLKDRACRIANRNLNLSEWKQYFGNEPYAKTCEDLPIDPSLAADAHDLVRRKLY